MGNLLVVSRRLRPGRHWTIIGKFTQGGEALVMIDLCTSETPNGWKATITFEEIGMSYKVHAIDLGEGDQKKPEFLKLNPNGRIPAMVDRDEDNLTIFESGAIMLYLAEK
jgi:GST-like protein